MAQTYRRIVILQNKIPCKYDRKKVGVTSEGHIISYYPEKATSNWGRDLLIQSLGIQKPEKIFGPPKKPTENTKLQEVWLDV